MAVEVKNVAPLRLHVAFACLGVAFALILSPYAPHLGEEIWQQMGGKVEAFVHSIGTGASLRGVATVLRRHNPKVRIVAVEPGESPALSGGKPGAHDIEGIGIGYTPPLWKPDVVDEIVTVKTDDAKAMARRMAREEGLFAGTSSGANVIAALRVAERIGPEASVVTLMVDSGLKYLSTDVYKTQGLLPNLDPPSEKMS